MIGSNPTDATFLVGNDHPVLHGVKVVLLAQGSEQFNRRFIGSLCHGFCGSSIRTSEGCPTRVLDTGRFTHFNPNVGVVGGSASVPAPVVPRKGLIYSAGVSVNEPMHTDFKARTVPVLHEHRSIGLGTSHGMKHQPFHRDLPAAFVAIIFCQKILYQFHCSSSPFA